METESGNASCVIYSADAPSSPEVGRIIARMLYMIFAALSFAPQFASSQDFIINKIVGNLNQPTQVAFAPGDDNDLYIAELRSGSNVNNLGRIVRYDRSTQTKSTVIDLSSIGTLDDGGLVGLAFHPDFQTNGLFYIDYNRSESGTYNNYIQEYHMNPDGPASLTSRGTILKYPTLNSINYHTIDWIGFDPTATGAARNYLYVTTGDGGPNIGTGFATSTVLPAADRNGPYPIKPTNLYGKILRLNVDPAAADAYPSDASKNFAIPPSNPFASAGGGLPEVVAGGLKNPFRMSFDRATGDIYLGDVGNNGREEVDFIKAGTLGSQALARNFGWPVKEGLLDPPAGVTSGSSFNYTNPDATVPLIDPIHEHHHITDTTVDLSLRANTIIGGIVYHGPVTSLAGKYIYGDYWTNHLYTANFDRNTSPTAFNGANLTQLQEVRAQWEAVIAGGDPAHVDLEFPVDFAEDSQGNVYIVSFGNSPNDTLNGGSVRNSAGLGLGQIYELVPFIAPALGDINRDGHVNAADVSALLPALVDLKTYQGSLTDAQIAEFADLTGDGKVTNADLQGLIQYLLSGGSSASAPPAVPEPDGLVLSMVGGIAFIACRRLVARLPNSQLD